MENYSKLLKIYINNFFLKLSKIKLENATECVYSKCSLHIISSTSKNKPYLQIKFMKES